MARCRWAMNILIVFLVSGIWHGSGWTFLVWGLLHGLYQIVGKATERQRNKLKNRCFHQVPFLTDCVSILITFVLVCIAWTFFRSPTVVDAVKMLSGVLRGNWHFSLLQLGVKANEWWLSIILIGFLLLRDCFCERVSLLDWVEKRVLPIRWIIYLGFLFVLILFGKYGSLSAQSFIYVSF